MVAVVVAFSLLGIVAPATLTPTPVAVAATGADFNPGLIISDQVFFFKDSMAASSIQAFLNSKVGSCSAGYTCLKDYRESTRDIAADPMCRQYTGKPNQLASEIIYDVAQSCGVNPQVLLVLLQKEQSLITSTAPGTNKYRSATGYGCPDTAACDAQFYGFFNQVYKAAWAFQRYGMPAGTGPGTPYTTRYTWYPVGTPTAVLYNPNSGCGTQAVTIQNRATAALYYYTPYVPNAAALSNFTGTGDGCSSYGNRNFFRFFTEWFGSTVIPPAYISFVKAAYADVLGRGSSEENNTYWAMALVSGQSREQVAGSFNNSDEYRMMRIVEGYSLALGRSPDPEGASYWLGMMQSGAIQPDDAYRTFLASQEMYDLQGGGTDEGYINAIYRQILHRDADAEGIAYWVGFLTRGLSRSAITNSMWFSPETYNVRVDDTYRVMLGRGAGLSEQRYWSGIAATYGHTRMRSAIMATEEYYARAQLRFP
jgi:hypothetical protein